MPPPRLTVDAWADQYRVLPDTAAEPGRWRTARTPYLRGPMEALSPSHPAEWVVLMKGGQVGGTEIGNNWVGYTIHLDPAPMLIVQPTEQMVKANTYERLNPLIEATPEIRGRIAPPRSRDRSNSIFRKDFVGGFLRMTAAVSPIGLRSSPVPRLFLDEVDAYPMDAGGEGEPVELAEKRTVTFGGRAKKYMVSTPTTAGRSRIGRHYRRSNQQRYFVRCRHCGEWDWLRW
jgi:phage terminase large subunit GpA-like protein